MESKITRIMTRDGSARLIFIDSTAIVERAHEIHSTSKTMTATLGRCLTATSMMGVLLKDKGNTVTLKIKGSGPAGSIICISDYAGDVRGYAENPEVELPPNALGKLDVGGSVGEGSLTVIKDLGLNEPYIGVSNLVSGEIAEDITEYFAVSEQTPTVCSLGVLCNTDNSCKAAGGFLLQLLPNADETIIPILEANISSLPPVSTLIRDKKSAEETAKMIFGDIEFDIFDEILPKYKCPCSRDSYVRALISLGKKELAEMVDEGKTIETRCLSCGQIREFTVDELREMMNAAVDRPEITE